ncbi:MAG: hypothetical protein ABIO86_20865 [Sphingomonas sp.]
MIGRYLLAGLCAVTLSTSALGASEPRESWGKTGVSLVQYQDDAVSCASRAYYQDVAQTDGAKRLVEASRRIDGLASIATGGSFPYYDDPAVSAIARTVAAARPDKAFHEVGALQQSTLDTCLSQRGYVRFRLTEDQRQRLGKLRNGSPERRAYLHSLASDAAVLAAQHI